jgi:hypothetical protein
MAQADREGFAKGAVERSYPAFGEGAPLLNTFYFRFDRDGQSQIDNHLNSMWVLPGGESTDLSPNADLEPSKVSDGKIELTLMDRDPTSASDRYFYKIGHAVLSGVVSRRFQIRDLGGVGEIRRDLPESIFQGGGRAALAGFKLFYTGGRDHHVDKIEVQFINNDRTLVVSLSDRDNNDVFGYLVDFLVLRPALGGSSQTGASSGSASGGQRIELPSGPSHAEWGIRGFRFDYPERGDDRHLREVGVVKQGRDLTVFYGDEEGDLEFNWSVKWIYVGPPVAAPS